MIRRNIVDESDTRTLGEPFEEQVDMNDIKTIEITTQKQVPPENQEQYEALKHQYTQLTEKQTRTDADREEMARLIEKAKEILTK